MPNFAILVTRDSLGWYVYALVIEHKVQPSSVPYSTATAAFKAAIADANLKGHYNE